MNDEKQPKIRFRGFEDPWKQRKLGEVGQILRSSINPKDEPDSKFVQYSMPSFDNSKKPNEILGKTVQSTKFKISGKILLINKLNVRRKRIWFVKNAPTNSIASSEFMPFTAKNASFLYLEQLLLSDRSTNDLVSMSSGTSNSQKRITPSSLLNYRIYLPKNITEQSEIGIFLTSIDNLITLHQSKLNQLKELKKLLMQKSFSQQWRFKGFTDPWEQRKLESLGILERGKSKHRPRNDPRLFGGKIPFIQTGDISNSNLFLTKYSQTLSDFGLKQSKIWKSGTLVITIAANIADTAITTFDTAFPDSIIGFQSQKVDLIFVKAELDRQSKLIKKKADVGTQANLNLKKLGNLCFMIPNIKEQKLIANLLKNMNYSIAANRCKLEFCLVFK